MMKLVCINNISSQSPNMHKKLLTIGKIYESKGGEPAQFRVTCDDGTIGNFSMSRFVSIEEYRDKQLNRILAE